MQSTAQLSQDDRATEVQQQSPDLIWEGTFLPRKPRLLFLVTEDWYFRSHRLDLAREAQRAGMEVIVITLADDGGEWLRSEGFTYLPIPFVKGSKRLIRQWSAVIKLAKLYRQARPDIVHHVAVKPILYGSWAAKLAGVPAVVNAFGGLGFVFSAHGWKARLIRTGVKAGLRSALSFSNCRIIFQNRSDHDELIRQNIVKQSQTVLIRGVGVDLKAFAPQPEMSGLPVVALPARMLWDKGIGEFVEAARIVRRQGIEARFVLIGRVDPGNPTHISEGQLHDWQREGVVEWWGHRDDMPQVLAGAHIVVLPTHYEGFPKVLLEASACGKPVIATDIPGCEAIVRRGQNGFLVPAKDPEALAKAIKVLLDDPVLRARMGRLGREIAEREFSAERMARQTMAVYRELLETA